MGLGHLVILKPNHIAVKLLSLLKCVFRDGKVDVLDSDGCVRSSHDGSTDYVMGKK